MTPWLGLSVYTPQPHPRPLSVGELDAGFLKSTANSRHSAIGDLAPFPLVVHHCRKS